MARLNILSPSGNRNWPKLMIAKWKIVQMMQLLVLVRKSAKAHPNPDTGSGYRLDFWGTKNMMNARTAVLMFGLVTLTGCTNMNIFKDNDTARAPANDPIDLPADPAEPGQMTAEQIQRIISGKSWKWQSPRNSGVTLYADDGSSLVEVTGKGTTTGKWQAKNGQLCESFAPAPFLPNGVAMTCQPFSGSGNTYKVGQATFTLA